MSGKVPDSSSASSTAAAAQASQTLQTSSGTNSSASSMTTGQTVTALSDPPPVSAARAIQSSSSALSSTNAPSLSSKASTSTPSEEIDLEIAKATLSALSKRKDEIKNRLKELDVIETQDDQAIDQHNQVINQAQRLKDEIAAERFIKEQALQPLRLRIQASQNKLFTVTSREDKMAALSQFQSLNAELREFVTRSSSTNWELRKEVEQIQTAYNNLPTSKNKDELKSGTSSSS